MSPEDPELEEFARKQKKEVGFKEAVALPEAKLAFHRFVETEQDEIKREKLQEFIKFVDGAQSIEDINWFREKAIKTAAASRALADKAIADEQARLIRKNQVIGAWVFGIILIAVILGTGIGKTYHGRLPDGTVIEMESEVTEIIPIDKKPTKLVFSHYGYALNKDVMARSIAAGVVLVLCVLFTLSKDL